MPEHTEKIVSPERQLFRAECIVVPGHSIERVQKPGGDEWKPTRLIQGVNEKGWRTGKRVLDVDKDKAIVGGGNAVTLAAAQYFEDLKEVGALPQLVIFPAGRPAYLEENAPEDPDLCEGGPMVEVFERETSATEILGKDNVVILSKNHKNTRDDIEKSVELAVSRGFSKIAFLLLGLRLERAMVFWENMKQEKPDLASLDVRFLPAEDFLRERYKDHPELIEKILSGFESSPAFAKTSEAEKGGVKAVRNGSYKGKGQY